MSEEKIKVSDLSEQEQKDLIAEAYAVGLQGTFNGWKVETLKNKIAEAKAKKEGDGTDEQSGPDDEQNAQENEQNEGGNEQNGSNDEQNEGGQDTEETSEAPNPPEVPEDLKNNEKPKGTPKKKVEKANKPKEGICHICRSKVIDGVCTGCGFHK